MNDIARPALTAQWPGTHRRFLWHAAACVIALGGAFHAARAQTPPTVDWSTSRDPVTARIALTPAQMAQARLNVPAGTRAYAIGGAQAPRKLYSWYRASDGKLLAALEVVTVERPVSHDGVRVSASAGTQGRATALLEVGTPRDEAALLAAHDLTLRGADAGVTTAVPLLAYRGSTHVVALAPNAEQKLLRAPKFDVQGRNAAGVVQTELLGMSLSGGAVPVAIGGAVTKPGVPVEVFVTNPGSESRFVQAELMPPLQWQQRAGQFGAPASPQAASVIAAPQARTPLGTVVSDAPGAFNLNYRDAPVHAVESGTLTSGPLVCDPSGATGFMLNSQEPLSQARINYDAPSNLIRTQPRPPAPTATISEQSGGGGNHVQRTVLAGALVGAATIALIDRAGRTHQGTVTIVPNEERDLQRQGEWVMIAAVETGATVQFAGAQDKTPCQCEKLTAKFAPAGANPDANVAGSIGGANDSVLTVTIDANWLASITCTKGDGDCIGTLGISAESSNWTIGGKEATPVPKSEDFFDADPAALKKGRTPRITCTGPCGKETPGLKVATRYEIKVAHGKLQGKAPDEFGGRGKIDKKDAISGWVTLRVRPSDCPGDGWVMKLHVTGQGGVLKIDWPTSDRDGDGKPDAKDKVDDPTPMPKPKPKPGK